MSGAQGPTDEFVEMLPAMGSGDPSSTRLTALIRYRLVPTAARRSSPLCSASIAPWESAAGIPSATGRFLVSDGWDYLRFVGFESLGDYRAYWSRIAEPGYSRIAELTAARREIILAAVPELVVR